ncbi:transcriptional regulator, LacI family [Rhodoferax sp. OV413]|uniref:LacI family DNA-binding transcriptional regulator n=1 Tax=Rhodoferax sp. OV413 TaxID=1855285 RepID=UPI000884605F|nr:LacI family DNA-binding transcriptional regulator [Rhodoferax sp. OV413]SDO33489.1 transcriptional regulator, LacI family [Rhodoferax sp. OV413]
MASIKDVARHANVSISTVSHVVNRTRFVSDKARQDVETAIRALGYVPSAVARSLKSNTTRTLGMLIPNCSNPYFAEIVRSVEDHCFASGYTLILCNTDDEPLRQSVYLKVLAEKRVDGLIIISTGEDSDLHDLLQGLTTPTVLLDREVTHVHCDLVETANVQGGQMAAEHLVALGHRRIACIGGPADLSPSAQRIQGWRNALAAAELEANDLLWHSDFSSQGGFTAMQEILQSGQQPTAVFVCNDLMGIGALSAAHEAGLRIPQDLSVIGFDDIELARFTSPPLTTIVQPKQRIGMLAVDMLLERIQGGRLDAKQVLLQPELIVRASTASPPSP